MFIGLGSMPQVDYYILVYFKAVAARTHVSEAEEGPRTETFYCEV